MAKLLLIDGDSILYRAGFATEKTKYLAENGNGFGFTHYDDAKTAKANMPAEAFLWSRKEVEPVENALALAKAIVTDIQDRYAAWDEMRLWLTPGVGNFRDQIATRAKYKGNRDAMARPTHYAAIRDYLIEKWGAKYTEGQEADDAIGIDMTANPGSVCVSFDKDMLQIPGLHYNWVDKTERVVTKREADMFFWQQVLSGDPVDNVPGIKGIGPQKAKKILEGAKSNKECWERIGKAYEDEYGTFKAAQFSYETARLVYVRRYDNETWKWPT